MIFIRMKLRFQTNIYGINRCRDQEINFISKQPIYAVSDLSGQFTSFPANLRLIYAISGLSGQFTSFPVNLRHFRPIYAISGISGQFTSFAANLRYLRSILMRFTANLGAIYGQSGCYLRSTNQRCIFSCRGTSLPVFS